MDFKALCALETVLRKAKMTRSAEKKHKLIVDAFRRVADMVEEVKVEERLREVVGDDVMSDPRA